MSPLVYSLVPRTYVKKSHKSSIEFRDVDNFIVELRRRIVDCWNYRFEVDGTNGTGYKLKFEQFEKKFLKNSDFVCYIVNSTSEEAFKNCLGKLLKSCKHSEKLKNIIVLSLNLLPFTELDSTPIKCIYFGDDWLSENACQWTKLENILKNQDNIDPYDGKRSMLESHYLTIPHSNSGRKSPSKIKNFFHSLPSKFDIDKTRSLHAPKTDVEFHENTTGSHHDIRLPDINVLDIDRSKYDGNDPSPNHKQKDHSKLSFNSLFRRRSKKTRDSGLSMGSSVSNGSSSRNSGSIVNSGSISADPIFDCKTHMLSDIKHAPPIHIASLLQTEKHKARIENFKTKGHKPKRSTSCLSNNKKKESKYQVKEVINKVIDFSTTIISASSEVGIRSENINNNRRNLDYRGKSEPLMKTPNSTSSEPQLTERIKYYSWTEDSFEEKEDVEDKTSSNNLETNLPILEFLTSRDMLESYEESNVLDDFQEIIDDFNDENPSSLLNYKNKCEDENAIIDDEIFFTPFTLSNSELQYTNENQSISAENNNSVSYKTFINEEAIQNDNENQSNDAVNGTKTSEISNNSFTMSRVGTSSSNVDLTKDDPMESLDILIKSIQISCDEMRAARKSQEYIDGIPYTNEELDDEFVDDSEKTTVDMNTDIEESQITFNKISENFEEHKAVWLESDIPNSKKDSELTFNWELEDIEVYREMSPELIAVADSMEISHFKSSNVLNKTRNWIRNPLIVTGLFAATTYMAPTWVTYIPRNVSFIDMFSGTLQYLMSNEIVQSIPNQIISSGRIGVIAATQTIKRFLILLPSTPWMYGGYNAVPV